jgi:hypothetical protein
MRQLTLWLLAAFLFTSCDNLKTKDTSKSEDDTEETTKKKKKKPLEEDEDASDEEQTTKKKKNTLDDDVDDDEATSNDETNSDNSKGWSKADQNKFITNCTQTASSSMGEERAEEYCTCMMKKIEKRYPNSSEVDQMTESEITKLAKTCVQ